VLELALIVMAPPSLPHCNNNLLCLYKSAMLVQLASAYHSPAAPQVGEEVPVFDKFCDQAQGLLERDTAQHPTTWGLCPSDTFFIISISDRKSCLSLPLAEAAQIVMYVS